MQFDFLFTPPPPPPPPPRPSPGAFFRATSHHRFLFVAAAAARNADRGEGVAVDEIADDLRPSDGSRGIILLSCKPSRYKFVRILFGSQHFQFRSQLRQLTKVVHRRTASSRRSIAHHRSSSVAPADVPKHRPWNHASKTPPSSFSRLTASTPMIPTTRRFNASNLTVVASSSPSVTCTTLFGSLFPFVPPRWFEVDAASADICGDEKDRGREAQGKYPRARRRSATTSRALDRGSHPRQKKAFRVFRGNARRRARAYSLRSRAVGRAGGRGGGRRGRYAP
ncbi:uncharacterized protein MICPUCDRAFT_57091 [Micromonas pusilla CCMP1545]|uniref:Predicted protein n=1 Tax=Micromonas pusilla (strain CCMP1545) TaxID=564608 RepID=C1MPY7_MICPC|nr:uncharacterized protein MICPUCDRAFT_57091 [Micromonas pusilla CCMP1545]EEH57981.1 predicted protein [Micromonas pusilla CCMP1545]|eukprot:XP_003058030.1 predicted protein [Micromonas pusilla CCMP1545]